MKGFRIPPSFAPIGVSCKRREWKGLESILLSLLLSVGLAAAAGEKEAGRPEAEVLRSGSWSMELPLGLQADAAYVPESNPMTEAKIALGKLLYFDPRLSKDGTVSCASCHNPFHGFADPAPTSKGVRNQLGTRNSPTVINRLFSQEQFWDGRAKDLEEQVLGPLTNPVEMANASHDEAAQRIGKIAGYRPLFEKAFGDPKVDIERIAKAIAAYERTVVSGDSPFDRYQAGDRDAMSPSAVRGMELFNGKANCKACHSGFNFTDESYHNLGVGWGKDPGRFEVTKNEEDRGAFKTPTLRNVALTAPYMHDGSEATLEEVVEFYDRGGNKNPNLSPEMKPLGLSEQEKRDLVAFLHALTGPVRNAEPPASLPR
ncbi:MAG: cytochrome-c peroxidase [Candidatus Binatia bacterium]|nr:MAG: cytochrome-c peroxidase [Candidatus Binatia bacterium]